jgi:predicted Holliday junction resolvase-like endonuclease
MESLMNHPEYFNPGGAPGIQLIILLCVFLFFCLIFLIIGLHLGTRAGRKQEAADWKGRKIEEIVKARLKASRAVLGGLVSEQMAPLLPGFPFDPGDCRFIGKPVDFLIFRGMNRKDITEVIFLEVKSGSGRALNDQEKRLRDVIKAGRVRWAEFDV